MSCTHDKGEFTAKLNHVLDEKDNLIGHQLVVTCSCRVCGAPFTFPHLNIGPGTEVAETNADATELRIPIEPSTTTTNYSLN